MEIIIILIMIKKITIFTLLGSGIKCHQCNSYDEYHCGDPFYYADTPDQPKTDKFLKDCPNDGKEYFCRKIFQNGKLSCWDSNSSTRKRVFYLRLLWEFELLCNIYSNSIDYKSSENAIPHQIISYLLLKLSIWKQIFSFVCW